MGTPAKLSLLASLVASAVVGWTATDRVEPHEVRPAAQPIGVRPQEPVGKALIVAVGRYGSPPPAFPGVADTLRGYGNLNAANDTLLIKAALAGFGFSEENIRVVHDEEATAEGIRAAFQQLIDDARPGDMIAFHYSGHGHQIGDEDTPLEETDGYDEVLVPHDAPSEYVAGYDGSLHIRDDEVGAFLDALRAKVGPTGLVTAFLDACFSGTGTRGPDELPTRGATRALGPPSEGSVRVANDSIGIGPEGVSSDGPLADYVVLSAASNRQLAREVFMEADPELGGEAMVVGPLSYGLAKSFSRLPPGGTYRDLFVLLKQSLNGKIDLRVQMPQAEGALDNEVFSTLERPAGSFVSVDAIRGDGRVVLGGGSLMGLNAGSEVAFFPLGGTPTTGDEPVARGRVTAASALSSWVTLEEPAEADLMETRAYPVSLSYAFHTRVKLSETLGPSRAALERSLGELALVRLVDEAPDLLVLDSSGIRVRNVRTGEDLDLGSPVTTVAKFARSRFLQELSLDADHIDVRFELRPADRVGDRCTSTPDWSEPYDGPEQLARNTWRLSYDRGFFLRIVNRGADPVYATVVDLMPNGDHWVLFPDETASREVTRDRPLDIPCYVLHAELGVETLKLFVTDEQVDFRPSFGLRSRAGEARGNLAALEELMDDVVGGTRAGRSVPAGSGRTYDILIEVVEPRR